MLVIYVINVLLPCEVAVVNSKIFTTFNVFFIIFPSIYHLKAERSPQMQVEYRLNAGAI